MKRAQDILFSIVVPVYNRPDEVDELMQSLAAQTDKGFEAVITEDGSTLRCDASIDRYRDKVRVKYYYKDNEGRSIARNHSMAGADGDYFIFVDSDCILPPDYIERLRASLAERPVDCYGGPDAAHDSFTDIQKAINYAMTAFLTTGGIRGGKVSMEKFTPRTFNMGFSRSVWQKVGGFREMFSEDIDMSTRIRQAGFSITLFPEVKVYHKRRVNLHRFWHQVHVFGQSRITLQLLYPGSMKAVHWLPAVFTVGSGALVAGAALTPWSLLPLGVYFGALWGGALKSTRSVKIATMSMAAAAVQLVGYGTGFLKAYFTKIVLGRGRDLQREIEIRKGANEEKQ